MLHCTALCRERESHTAHLASIEAEMDSQVARVEAAARRQAQVTRGCWFKPPCNTAML